MRNRINSALREAQDGGSRDKLAMLRLINAAIVDKDFAARSSGRAEGISDEEILDVLVQMIKQREKSIVGYNERGHLALADRERAEIGVLQELLPRQLSGDEIDSAVDEAIKETGATCVRDKGRVMGALKTKYRGQMDFSHASVCVADRLC